MTEEHYRPRDIQFSRSQMIWLILWLPVLEEGRWPSMNTGYTESQAVQTSPGHHAPFETAALIYAEVSKRIERCGDAGVTLVWEIQHELNSYVMLSPAAKQALNYCSGWRRRHMSFSKWCSQKEYREERKGIFMARFSGKQDLSKKQIENRARRKKNRRR